LRLQGQRLEQIPHDLVNFLAGATFPKRVELTSWVADQ
jgi:hypothetical protein